MPCTMLFKVRLTAHEHIETEYYPNCEPVEVYDTESLHRPALKNCHSLAERDEAIENYAKIVKKHNTRPFCVSCEVTANCYPTSLNVMDHHKHFD